MDVLRTFYERFTDVVGSFYGCFTDVLRRFYGGFTDVAGTFYGCFTDVLRFFGAVLVLCLPASGLV